MFQTEYSFTLPKGYVDEAGNLHRDGVMRLATAADEILPLCDLRVERNPAYLLIILLSRVVIKLGEFKPITPDTIEELFSEDVAYLQTFFNQINGMGQKCITIKCPKWIHLHGMFVVAFRAFDGDALLAHAVDLVEKGL